MPLEKSARVLPPPGRPVMPRINAIQDEGEQEEEEFHESEDFHLIAEFMRVGETNQYWRAAHREARVKLPSPFGDTQRKVRVMTLFDTGASGNNFVSDSFVKRHDLLECVRPMKIGRASCRERVCLYV